MKKYLFGFICLFFLLSNLDAEGGVFDNLKKTITPSEKNESVGKPKESNEQELKELATEFEKVVIKPFGSLEWEDTLWTVVEKLNKIDGAEEIGFPGGPKGAEKLSLKGINKKEFLEKMDEYADDFIWGQRGPSVRIKTTDYAQAERQYLMRKGSNDKFKDFKGNEKMAERISDIRISPIIIKGVPFVMTIKFEKVYGIAIAKPDELFPSAKKKISFPVVLYTVTLSSNSPMLKDKYEEINNLFDDKYGKFKDKQFLGKGHAAPVQINWHPNTKQWTCRVIDQRKYKLNVVGGPGGYSIEYTTSEEYIKNLNEIYRKHLADLEGKKVGDKKDMSHGL